MHILSLDVLFACCGNNHAPTCRHHMHTFRWHQRALDRTDANAIFIPGDSPSSQSGPSTHPSIPQHISVTSKRHELNPRSGEDKGRTGSTSLRQTLGSAQVRCRQGGRIVISYGWVILPASRRGYSARDALTLVPRANF